MSRVSSRWVSKRAVLALTAALALSPVTALPAMATEADGGADPVETTVGETPTDDEGLAAAPRAAGVATVNGVSYDSLSKALAAVPSTGEQTAVVLTDNIVMETADIVTIAAGQNVVLDMAGHSITVDESFVGRPIVNEGTLLVTGNGTIDSSASAAGGYGAINNHGALTIENGTYSGNVKASGSCIRNTGSAAKLTVNNGRFDKATCMIYNEGTAVLNDGSYIGRSCSGCDSSAWAYTLQNHDANDGGPLPTFTVNGGTYEGVQGVASSSIGSLVINGGTFTAKLCDNGHQPFYALYVAGEDGYSTATVNGGEFVNEGTRNVVMVANDNTNGDGGINADASVTLAGGTFTSKAGVNGVAVHVQNLGSVLISGGTYNGKVECKSADQGGFITGGSFSQEVDEKYLAPGFAFDANSGQVAPSETSVASVSNANGVTVGAYATLAEALASAPEGGTVVLLASVTESVTVPADKSVTLDLAGNTITNADGSHTVTVAAGGTLTIADSSADKSGVIDNVSHAKGALVNHGTVIVKGGALTRSAEAGASATDNGGNSWYVIDNQGTLTFDGGSVTSTGKFSSLIRNLNGKLTVNDGTFKNGFIVLKNDDGGTLDIKGGTITSDEQAVQSWSTTTISGGTLNGSVIAWDSGEGGNSTTTISGGTINGDVKAVNYMSAKKGPEVTISGGTITGEITKGTHDGQSGVRPADPSDASSQITVSGGTFKTPVDDDLIVEGSGLNKNEDGTYGIHEHKGEAVAAVVPTCDTDGNKAHWRCSVCGELFADEALSQPLAAEDVVVAATHHASATHVEAVEPTATTAGNYEYWHCPDCGKYFSDKALTKETTLDALTRPALGEEPAETFTVTFDFGTGAPNRTVTVVSGDVVERPDDPTYEGWTFANWFTDDGTFQNAYDFSTPVTDDLTLYAGWFKDEGDKPSTPPAKGDELANTGDVTSVAAPIAVAALGASAVAGALAARRRGRKE